ncbi:16S rRNA (guanine(966)-N(2))-methyltransferase RsmD [Candidatus Saccharibacteria bacterium]|nr:16S rRNA (guanine(966)-N(2))-methyltransferase RsmD [Candidatus Saccharibacteria bacterium]
MIRKERKNRGGEARISGGVFRGRKIKTPGAGTHPMGERERLALFNMIADLLDSAMVLDAYAGSGALGIEALSRGAAKVVFVEKNRAAAGVISDNLSLLGASGEVVVYDAAKYESDLAFDLILADPPYDAFELDGVINLSRVLKDGGVLALSHPSEAPMVPGLQLEKSRTYAGATISIYRK